MTLFEDSPRRSQRISPLKSPQPSLRLSPRRHLRTSPRCSTRAPNSTPRGQEKCLIPSNQSLHPPNPLSPSESARPEERSSLETSQKNLTHLFKSRVFTFLSCLTKDVLRKIGKDWGQKVRGKKDLIVFRVYKYVICNVKSEESSCAFLESNAHCPSFNDFSARIRETDQMMHSPPSWDELNKALTEAGDTLETYEKGALRSMDGNEEPKPFSLSEFARLAVIIKTDEECRQAMEKLQLELTRGEIDGGRTRECYWGVIARRFNDNSLRPCMSFVGFCEEADPARLPLTYRPASVLKTQFQNARSHFTSAKKRWELSGQNDPQRFWRFVHCKNQDSNFPTSIGKRCIILFRVSDLGTPSADTFFINISTKSMNNGGYEEGVVAGIPANIVDDPVLQDRKKRRVSTDSQQNSALSEMTGMVEKLVEQDRLFVTRMAGMGALEEGDIKKPEEDPETVRMKRIERMSHCVKLMDELKTSTALAKERNEDEEYISFLNSHYKLLREEYSELRYQK